MGGAVSHKNPADFRHASFQGDIGIARVEITPPVGIYARNWGAAAHDVAAWIHRPLFLTALTLNSANRRLVLVDADLGWWRTPQTYQKFMARLQAELSLNSADLIFALTHTHSGPPLMETDDSLPGSDLHRSWMEKLYQSTVQVIREAQHNESPSILDWETGSCPLATVRDLPDPQRDRIVCGYNPEGIPDPTLLVGRITDLAGRLRGVLVNYACHPTTLSWQNDAISPDYIGAMRDTIEQATSATSLFLLGMCGELAPRFQYVGDLDVADRHGRQLGHAALATLYGMEPPATRLEYQNVVESGAPLAIWRHTPAQPSQNLQSRKTSVSLPIKDWPSAEELERQRASSSDRTIEERTRRKRDIRRFLGDGTAFDLPIHAWRIGDALLIGSCCECYSSVQQDLRQRYPDRKLICMNLLNGSIGYLPPRELYDLDIYPVWQTPFDRGCMEITSAGMSDAIRDLLTDRSSHG